MTDRERIAELRKVLEDCCIFPHAVALKLVECGYTRQPEISPYEIPHAAYDKYFTPPEPPKDKVEAVAQLLAWYQHPENELDAIINEWHKESDDQYIIRDDVIEDYYRQARSILKLCQPEPTDRPKIVCLCGSTRFKDTFIQEYARLSDAGNIVLSVSRLIPTHRDDIEEWDFPEQENVWHKLHFRKIDLADEVHVLNVDGYIGESLRKEIAYATKLGKTVTYLELAHDQKQIKGE